MAKAHRSDASARERKGSSDVAPVTAQGAFPPNPPKRHPWFLALSAMALALWLLFLLWMAVGIGVWD